MEAESLGLPCKPPFPASVKIPPETTTPSDGLDDHGRKSAIVHIQPQAKPHCQGKFNKKFTKN
jgi:hypothetical protein